ncbi:MAG: hypothetical protein V8Q84_10645 [Bilophila sp.]
MEKRLLSSNTRRARRRPPINAIAGSNMDLLATASALPVQGVLVYLDLK